MLSCDRGRQHRKSGVLCHGLAGRLRNPRVQLVVLADLQTAGSHGYVCRIGEAALLRGHPVQLNLARRHLLGAPIVTNRVAQGPFRFRQRLDGLNGHMEDHVIPWQKEIPRRIGG